MKAPTATRGFTLIELLMVVAIISLLASIVIAALNSARDDARNVNRNETARQYIIALGLYHNTHGSFPTGGCIDPNQCADVTRVCLGNQSSCFVYEEHFVNSTVNTQIAEFIPALPALTEPIVVVGQEEPFSGIVYGCTTDTGPNACKGYSLTWVLEGDGDNNECPAGAEKVDGNAITFCTFSTGN
jgi:prepilin-type N-terminal cleavage/methylation domain-containing protein